MVPDILLEGYETAESPDEFVSELGTDGAARVEVALGFPEGSLGPGGSVAKVVFRNTAAGFRPYIAYREDRDLLSDRPYIGFHCVDRGDQDFAVLRNPSNGHLVLVAYFNRTPIVSISGINGPGDLPTLVNTAFMLWRYGDLVSDSDLRVFRDEVVGRLGRIITELGG